jgi:hypothetical protein
VAGLVIDDDLAVRPATISIQPSGASAWNVATDDGRPMAVELDADGIMLLDDPESWPLEAPPSA